MELIKIAHFGHKISTTKVIFEMQCNCNYNYWFGLFDCALSNDRNDRGVNFILTLFFINA